MRKRTYKRVQNFEFTEHGNAQYRGGYVCLATGRSHQRLLASLWSLLAATTLATLVPGIINPRGLSGCPYVVMPYVGQVVALVSVIWTTGRFTAEGRKLRAYVRDEIVDALPMRSIVMAAFAGITTIGEAIYLTRSGIVPGVFELVMIVCGLVTVACGYVIRCTIMSCTWEDLAVADEN